MSVPPIEDTRLTARFRPKRTLTGSTGCEKIQMVEGFRCPVRGQSYIMCGIGGFDRIEDEIWSFVMTMMWAYAARLPDDGSLVWPGRNRHGATPGWEYRLAPDLSPEAYWVIQRLCPLGLYDNRRLDWGAVAIKVDADGLRHVLQLVGSAGGPEMPAYYSLADQMGPSEEIALVAAEL